MQKSEKSHMGKAPASHPRKAVFRERAWPSWTSLLIGCTTPTPSVLSFFSGRQAQGSHPLRMKSHVASINAPSYVILYLFAEGAIRRRGLPPLYNSCSRSLRPLSIIQSRTWKGHQGQLFPSTPYS